jgi:hypothetical protein
VNWKGYVGRVGEMINVYTIFDGKPVGRRGWERYY